MYLYSVAKVKHRLTASCFTCIFQMAEAAATTFYHDPWVSSSIAARDSQYMTPYAAFTNEWRQQVAVRVCNRLGGKLLGFPLQEVSTSSCVNQLVQVEMEVRESDGGFASVRSELRHHVPSSEPVADQTVLHGGGASVGGKETSQGTIVLT